MDASNKTTPQLIPMSSSGLENLRESKSKCSQRIPLYIWLHLKTVEIMFVKEVSGYRNPSFWTVAIEGTETIFTEKLLVTVTKIKKK